MTFQPPAGLGPFTFPAPYGTYGIRLTDASNAPNGCEPRLYSYWSCLNNHRGQGYLYVVLGRIGAKPLLLMVDKARGGVSTVRELPIEGTGEGFYFSDSRPTTFYFLDGASLRRHDVHDGRTETVFTLQAKHGDDLWQAHSSADDQIHSATVRRRTTDGTYPKLGCVVDRAGHQLFFPSTDLDECQIDKSGRWLIIQEAHNNRIVDTVQGGERTITNEQGALAHLDVGAGWMAGEDDSDDVWQMSRWDLAGGDKRVLVYGPEQWGTGLGHLAIRGDLILHSSNATGDLWTVSADGNRTRSIAPGMIAPVPEDASEEEKYNAQLRACLDVTGEYACYLTNFGVRGGRMDAILVRLPGGPIVVRPDPKPDPKPGEPIVAGSQDYPSEAEGGWWEAFEKDVEALYVEAGKPFPDSPAAFRWHSRTGFDIGAGMDKQQSKVKHLRELRAQLDLTGGTHGNP